MVPLLEHATGLFKGRLNCHGPDPGFFRNDEIATLKIDRRERYTSNGLRLWGD